MNTPPVYVIVLSFNGRELTLDCLRTVLEDEYGNKVVIVVDNASTDGSARAIQEAFPDELESGRMLMIESGRNLGFAGGNNLGIERALRAGAEFVILLNNDTRIDRGMLSAVVSCMQSRPEVGIVGPKIYYFEPADRIWFAGGELKKHRGLSRHIGIRERDMGQFDEFRECDYVSGCTMVVRRNVFDAIGGLDAGYVMYGEDADFCFRAREKGFKIAYCPGGRVWHKVSAAVGGQVHPRKIMLRFLSNLRFYRRHMRWWHYPSIALFHGLDFVRILWLAATGRLRA